ncbi:hypothetical protein LI328DRAFT_61822 [Trichoderma asperelloides]|nr:hypothetical protein LI328DRAFT_61822 [Trichoderma asperelloides]
MRALGEREREACFWVVFFCVWFLGLPFFSLWCMFKRHGVFWLLAVGFWLVFWCTRSSKEQKRRDSKPTRGAVLAFAQEHWILFHPFFSIPVSLLLLLMRK